MLRADLLISIVPSSSFNVTSASTRIQHKHATDKMNCIYKKSILLNLDKWKTSALVGLAWHKWAQLLEKAKKKKVKKTNERTWNNFKKRKTVICALAYRKHYRLRCCLCLCGTKSFTCCFTKLLHTQTALNATTLNSPDSIKETLSWLQVPLWYILCWPFLDHIGWLYAWWTAAWQKLHKRLYCNSFPPLSSHPFCNDTYNLMFSRKVGRHSSDTHRYSYRRAANMADVTGDKPVSPSPHVFTIFLHFMLY